MRLFVAIESPPFSLPCALPRSPELHLTLAFLGEIEPDRVPGITGALARATASFAPFEISYAGGGTFPTSGRPRIAWAGVRDGAEELGRLRSQIATELARVGIVLEARPFLPHVTLLRVKRPYEADLARRLSAALHDLELARARVVEVTLFESLLKSSGAEHLPRARFRLEMPAPDAPSAPSQ
jgi:RNA 2',3'-cyclic 3'-phosphodiesterase